MNVVRREKHLTPDRCAPIGRRHAPGRRGWSSNSAPSVVEFDVAACALKALSRAFARSGRHGCAWPCCRPCRTGSRSAQRSEGRSAVGLNAGCGRGTSYRPGGNGFGSGRSLPPGIKASMLGVRRRYGGRMALVKCSVGLRSCTRGWRTGTFPAPVTSSRSWW